MKRVLFVFLLSTFYFLLTTLAASPVFAAASCYETVGTEQIATLSCLSFYLNKVLGLLFPLAGVVALAMLILGGIKFITSGGDPKQAESARATLTWAIAGLVVVFLSFAILRFVSLVTGVKFPWLPFS